MHVGEGHWIAWAWWVTCVLCIFNCPGINLFLCIIGFFVMGVSEMGVWE
jgi:hypothetical protein